MPRLFLALILITSIAIQPSAVHYDRIMFVGNSLTLHPPKADIEWSGAWGMAASQPDRDYVHRVQLALAIRQQSIPEIRVIRSDISWMDATIGSQMAEFSPDLVIIQMGNNTSPEALQSTYADAYNAIIQPARGIGARIIVLGVWGAMDARADHVRDVATSNKLEFVPINDLYTYSNMAMSERACFPDVCAHPGDRGMQAIADRIMDVLTADATSAGTIPQVETVKIWLPVISR